MKLLLLTSSTRGGRILVPRAHDPSGLWQGSRALAGPDFLSMRRAFVSCSRPIRFDEKSVNRGLPVLDQARALEPCHRPEGSWALGTRMRWTTKFLGRACALPFTLLPVVVHPVVVVVLKLPNNSHQTDKCQTTCPSRRFVHPLG